MVRGDRMDFVIQKAVELGVKSIVPLFTEHTTVKLDATRIAKRVTHWQSIAISACEQSGRCFVPTVEAPIALDDWLSQQSVIGFVANPLSQARLPASCVSHCLRVLIGPEGGLTEDEIVQCESHQWQSFSMGPRTLRTETAAVTAIAMMQTMWGDLQ